MGVKLSKVKPGQGRADAGGGGILRGDSEIRWQRVQTPFPYATKILTFEVLKVHQTFNVSLDEKNPSRLLLAN